MSSKLLSPETTSVRTSGRPKGIPSAQGRRILYTWDGLKQANPTLNNSALLNLVAEDLFGVRLNISVRQKERMWIKRTLKRYGRI